MRYKTVKGFNDIYNQEFRIGDYIKEAITEIAETYNYKQVDLSTLDYSDLYMDYYGKEVADNLYKIDNRYASSVTLRYNGVISLLRSALENKLYVDKSLATKLMANLNSYRFNKYDRKQHATKEEFVLLNMNFDNYCLDLENINLALDVLYALGMEHVDLTLYRNGMDSKSFEKIKTSLKEMDIYFKIVKNISETMYDGLYYELGFDGSVLVYGGRHNSLASELTAPSVPSSSLVFDIDELKNIIEFTSLTPGMEDELDFLVVSEDENFDDALKVASRLRELGVRADINYNKYDQNRIRDFIDRFNIPYNIITNHIDIEKGIVLVRNSMSKEEGNVYFEKFLEELLEHSKHNHE